MDLFDTLKKMTYLDTLKIERPISNFLKLTNIYETKT